MFNRYSKWYCCNTTGNVGSCPSGWTANPSTATDYDCATNYPGSTKVDNKCYKYSQTSCTTGWTCTKIVVTILVALLHVVVNSMKVHVHQTMYVQVELVLQCLEITAMDM